MKKAVSVILIILILINFITVSSFADEPEKAGGSLSYEGITEEEQKAMESPENMQDFLSDKLQLKDAISAPEKTLDGIEGLSATVIDAERNTSIIFNKSE